MAYLEDADFTLHVGDAREVLATLSAGSVDCCVTSPPYWGLRDYGTGAWDGGDPDCDHLAPPRQPRSERPDAHGLGTRSVLAAQDAGSTAYRDVCGKCGARRVDQQLGLEPTPDAYVARMVAVFREVRRVLADHGTCWVNLGDSYASGEVGRVDAPAKNALLAATQQPRAERRITQRSGLKPKDLVGIPWRVAFALQADGWYLRSDIVWSKPNPMPESVTDRPTKAHEYVFLLAKNSRYWFDQEAVREPLALSTLADSRQINGTQPPRERNRGGRIDGYTSPGGLAPAPDSGRNVRSVWEIATQPYPEAHFATFPEELARRCIVAGCPECVCGTCGKPRERIVETNNPSKWAADEATLGWANTHSKTSNAQSSKSLHRQPGGVYSTAQTLGWSDCGHGNYRQGVVLDPFLGSGTVALVARKHGRHTVGIELNETYAALAARRLQQLSLLAEIT